MFDGKRNKRAYQNIAGAYASSVVVHPRHARRDSGNDLIRDRADPFGQIFGGNSQPVLFADQNHLVAELGGGNIGHIDNRQIHAHAADDRSEAPARQDLTIVRMQASQPVGITDRERGDAAFATGGECEAVTYRLPAGTSLYHQGGRTRSITGRRSNGARRGERTSRVSPYIAAPTRARLPCDCG